MKGFLNQNKIDYVFFHLRLSADLPDELLKKCVFKKPGASGELTAGKIVFPLSEKPFDTKSVYTIDEIPVLFPIEKGSTHFRIENDSLLFNHDILKACFYLLSGYQEYKSENVDALGRFQYEKSVQAQLGIIHKPVVNYLFSIIIGAIRDFYGLEIIKMRSLFKNYAYMLTHDVDYVDHYTFENLLYKIKEVTGLVKTYYSFGKNLQHLLRSFFELIKPWKRTNPSWSFEYMREVERKNGFKSVFYFLPKDQKNKDSKYRFSDRRIKRLLHYLIAEQCEIGIHGTVRSVLDEASSKKIKTNLEKESGISVFGIRQHRLLYKNPQTLQIHNAANYKYDSTLCFAEHEGFRNSFCLPFRLYDIENDQMLDVWEIPLNAMDVTLFHYRELNFEQALNVIDILLKEVKMFNGVFTLLWHNDFFDEDRFPGIKDFYERLQKRLNETSPENLTGKDIFLRIIDKMP